MWCYVVASDKVAEGYKFCRSQKHLNTQQSAVITQFGSGQIHKDMKKRCHLTRLNWLSHNKVEISQISNFISSIWTTQSSTSSALRLACVCGGSIDFFLWIFFFVSLWLELAILRMNSRQRVNDHQIISESKSLVQTSTALSSSVQKFSCYITERQFSYDRPRELLCNWGKIFTGCFIFFAKNFCESSAIRLMKTMCLMRSQP